MRIGYGFDVHRFGGNKPLIICGVKIPYKNGLLAHSDGDVVLHATIDALLGASGQGDIGRFFPNTNNKFKNIDSRKLLRKTWLYIQNKGYFLGNLDVTIIAQQPKMSIYIPKMCICLSTDLKCDKNNINIKATTTDYLGFVGRSEGISCSVITLLTKKIYK
ncbi:2-C-methyl-D-erythritol 2,4-cyclodiphosphate synthase [Serratia symbiotica]|nr:2-C-methyl-D-erythritol 2,4-cyclodiphosphate synthase [Serratia symbiotica]